MLLYVWMDLSCAKCLSCLSRKHTIFLCLCQQPLYQKLADEAILREAFDDDRFRLTGKIHPLPRTIAESRYSEEDDVFNLWFMVVL